MKKEDFLEREALIAQKRIELLRASLLAINEKLIQIHNLLISDSYINEVTKMLDIKENQNEIDKKEKELVRMKKDTPDSVEEIKKTEEYLVNMKEEIKNDIYLKKRNKLNFTPERLWFNFNGIDFYIEFIIKANKNDTITNLIGCLIYGVSYYNVKEKVDDNPIISFFFDEYGVITATNDFENESWTFENDHLIDLHLRTLDKIWEEALYLVNKDKLQ